MWCSAKKIGQICQGSYYCNRQPCLERHLHKASIIRDFSNCGQTALNGMKSFVTYNEIIDRQQQKAERQNGRIAERSNVPEGLSLIAHNGYRVVLDHQGQTKCQHTFFLTTSPNSLARVLIITF